MKLGSANIKGRQAEVTGLGVGSSRGDVILVLGFDGRCAILSPNEAREIGSALIEEANEQDGRKGLH